MLKVSDELSEGVVDVVDGVLVMVDAKLESKEYKLLLLLLLLSLEEAEDKTESAAAVVAPEQVTEGLIDADGDLLVGLVDEQQDDDEEELLLGDVLPGFGVFALEQLDDGVLQL